MRNFVPLLAVLVITGALIGFLVFALSKWTPPCDGARTGIQHYKGDTIQCYHGDVVQVNP